MPLSSGTIQSLTCELQANCCAQGHFDVNCGGKLEHFIIQIFPCGPVIGMIGTKEPLGDHLQLDEVC